MDLTTIYDVVGILGTLASTAGLLWSRRAAKLSKPTGNGFAANVLASLFRIEGRQDLADQRLSQMESRLGQLERT